MVTFAEILSYVAFIGFEFVALCAMTRGGRGWPFRLLGFVVLLGVDFLLDRWWRRGLMSLDEWLAVCFLCNWVTLAVLTVVLSRESLGRRIFLALAYGAYAVCFAVVFHLFAYRNVCGLPEMAAGAIGLVVVGGMNLVFLHWILPWMPRENRVYRWRDPCIVAGAVFANMFACGLWPISAVTAPVRHGLAFVLASFTAWVAFPLLCRAMRDCWCRISAEHNLELMVSEVNVRRAALDEARRLRHDYRHHCIVLGDLLLKGKTKVALEYLNVLDEGKGDLPDVTRIWCENETLNAILAGSARKAAAKGVVFSAEAHVERMSPLPDVEMVAVVANLIENAIDACEKVKGDGRGKVVVIFRQRGNMFGLTITNPVSSDFRLSPVGMPCVEPGVGLCSVKRVIEHHSGDWQYTLENGLLTCEVMMYAGEKKTTDGSRG